MFKGMNPNLIVLWFVYFVFLTYYLFYSEELVSLYPLTLKSIIEEKQMGIDTCPVMVKLENQQNLVESSYAPAAVKRKAPESSVSSSNVQEEGTSNGPHRAMNLKKFSNYLLKNAQENEEKNDEPENPDEEDNNSKEDD